MVFFRGKEADFALLLQVRPRKTFRIKKNHKHRSKQVDNCPKQDAHKQGTLKQKRIEIYQSQIKTRDLLNSLNQDIFPKRSSKLR